MRTQIAYDRLLLLTDRLFHIQNQPNKISHESIVTNTHISKTTIPASFKIVRKTVKKYHYDRNIIMHEASYLEDELWHVKGLALLTSIDSNEESLDFQALRFFIRKYLKKRKREFVRINKNMCAAIGLLFDQMHPIYQNKKAELHVK